MMDQPIPMRTLSQVLEKLKAKGYDTELVMHESGHLENEATHRQYCPEDIEIVKTYRFEGNSDPADNVVVYLVKDQQNRFSYIMDAYGAESNNEGEAFDNFIRAIPTGTELEDDD